MSGWSAADIDRLTRHGVLAINFHELLPTNRTEAKRRLASLSRIGTTWSPESAVEADPAASHDAGPSVFVGFYDGYRDTAMWGAEVCAELGLRACYFPIFVPDVPGTAEVDDDDLHLLGQHHDIGFHTAGHLFVTEVSEANVTTEVVEPVRRIETVTGRPPLIGAWCGGSRFDPAHVGNQTLQRLGLPFLMSNWSIESIPTA